jgi:hypothetical protein
MGERYRAYAGVGSRQTPDDVLLLMEAFALWLAARGWTLRSGAAAGADEAFERGCDRAGGQKEIFLPGRRFRGHPSPLYEVTPEAEVLAARYHPACSPLAAYPRALLARNGYQVLGRDLRTPAGFLVCWTPDGALGTPAAPTGRATGGTGQAIRVAAGFGVPVYNLRRPAHLALVRRRLAGASGANATPAAAVGVP